MSESPRSKRVSAIPMDEFPSDLADETSQPFVPNGVPSLEEGPDPFDPERLRLKPDFSAAGTAGKVLQVGVRKPDKAWFVRVHPDPKQYYLETKMIELKSAGTLYLVAPEILPDLEALEESTLVPKRLYLTCTRQGDFFFWPITYYDAQSGRRIDSWTQSALEAAEIAKQQWVRVSPNQRMGRYDLLAAPYPTDPVWPTVPMNELLRRAFHEHLIISWDHDVLQDLRPEAPQWNR